MLNESIDQQSRIDDSIMSPSHVSFAIVFSGVKLALAKTLGIHEHDFRLFSGKLNSGNKRERANLKKPSPHQ